MVLDPLLDPIRRQVHALGFELVEFKRSGPPHRPTIQVRIDRPGSTPGQGVTAGDCARTSRALERFLAEQGIGPHYVLQTSSPGFERPVRFPEHWRRFLGREVRVRARVLRGHPRLTIVAVPDDDHVTLRYLDGTEQTLALADVRDATLLPKADSKGQSEGE